MVLGQLMLGVLVGGRVSVDRRQEEEAARGRARVGRTANVSFGDVLGIPSIAKVPVHIHKTEGIEKFAVDTCSVSSVQLSTRPGSGRVGEVEVVSSHNL